MRDRYNPTPGRKKVSGGSPKVQILYAIREPVTTGTDKAYPARPDRDFTVKEVYVEAKIGPTGSDFIVDVNNGGVTMFATQANRPKILDGQTDFDLSPFAHDRFDKVSGKAETRVV